MTAYIKCKASAKLIDLYSRVSEVWHTKNYYLQTTQRAAVSEAGSWSERERNEAEEGCVVYVPVVRVIRVIAIYSANRKGPDGFFMSYR